MGSQLSLTYAKRKKTGLTKKNYKWKLIRARLPEKVPKSIQGARTLSTNSLWIGYHVLMLAWFCDSVIL